MVGISASPSLATKREATEASLTSGGASRQAIEHHYDVGHDFYRLWLDSAMVYSCALWPGELDEDLEAAQRAKLDWHVQGARAHGADRVLDIGCGWGALLGYLHDDCAVRHVAGLTLSSDQAATARAARPYADVRLEAWRNHQPDKPYDAIISIGAFEHFSRRELAVDQRRRIYTDFFDRCASWLVEGGRLSLQTIAYEDFDPSTDIETSFFDDVFPESTLPYLSDVVVAAEPAFRVVALRADPAHYEHTLRLWQQRLEAHKDQAIALVGRDTYRHYLRYLRVSRALFERRVTTLYRVVLERRALRHRDNDARADV